MGDHNIEMVEDSMFPGCFIMIQIILIRLFHWIGVWFFLFLF